MNYDPRTIYDQEGTALFSTGPARRRDKPGLALGPWGTVDLEAENPADDGQSIDRALDKTKEARE